MRCQKWRQLIGL